MRSTRVRRRRENKPRNHAHIDRPSRSRKNDSTTASAAPVSTSASTRRPDTAALLPPPSPSPVPATEEKISSIPPLRGIGRPGNCPRSRSSAWRSWSASSGTWSTKRHPTRAKTPSRTRIHDTVRPSADTVRDTPRSSRRSTSGSMVAAISTARMHATTTRATLLTSQPTAPSASRMPSRYQADRPIEARVGPPSSPDGADASVVSVLRSVLRSVLDDEDDVVGTACGYPDSWSPMHAVSGQPARRASRACWYTARSSSPKQHMVTTDGS